MAKFSFHGVDGLTGSANENLITIDLQDYADIDALIDDVLNGRKWHDPKRTSDPTGDSVRHDLGISYESMMELRRSEEFHNAVQNYDEANTEVSVDYNKLVAGLRKENAARGLPKNGGSRNVPVKIELPEGYVIDGEVDDAVTIGEMDDSAAEYGEVKVQVMLQVRKYTPAEKKHTLSRAQLLELDNEKDKAIEAMEKEVEELKAELAKANADN